MVQRLTESGEPGAFGPLSGAYNALAFHLGGKRPPGARFCLVQAHQESTPICRFSGESGQDGKTQAVREPINRGVRRELLGALGDPCFDPCQRSYRVEGVSFSKVLDGVDEKRDERQAPERRART